MGVSSADNLAQNNPVAGRLRISVAALRKSTKTGCKMTSLLVKWGIQVKIRPIGAPHWGTPNGGDPFFSFLYHFSRFEFATFGAKQAPKTV